MKTILDKYGNVIKDGDYICMPHPVDNEYYKNNTVNGYYITQVKYNKEQDRLEGGNGYGISFACGVVKIN